MRLHALRPSVSAQLLGKLLLWAAVMILLAFGLAARAETPSQSLRKDDLVIYYGVLPAERIPPQELNAPGTHMSLRDARRPGAHHVLVALFDARTGERIEEAAIMARIVPLSGAAEEKALKPMHSDDGLSFGQFFRLETDMPYVIHLRIHRADAAGKDVEAQFRYQHPSR